MQSPLDNTLLLWINGHHSPFCDQLMFTASRPITWLLLYVALIALLVYAYHPQQSKITNQKSPIATNWWLCLLAIAAVAASAGLADFVTSGILKPLFARPRPSHSSLEPLLHFVNGYQGGHYGFPSSHAADTTAVAVSFCLLYGKRKGWQWLLPIMIGYILLNCYSRMYLGVHYPSDILVGLIIGALLAWGVAAATKKIMVCKQQSAG